MPENAQQSIPIDQLVDRYIRLRDKVEDIKKRHKAELETVTAAMVKVEKFLLGQLQSMGVDSVKTPAGTPYIKTHTSITVADKAQFLGWVRETQNWEFLDVRPLKEPVVDFMKQNAEDENAAPLPPGIAYSESKVLNVTRNQTKSKD